MKLAAFLSLQLICVVVHSQNGYVVTYYKTPNYPGLSKMYFMNVFRDRVVCDKNLCFYYALGTGADPHKKKKNIALEASVYFDPEKQITYTVHLMPKEVGNVLLKDSIAAGNWLFMDRTKKLKGYRCKLAVTVNNLNDTTFVWYTEEIPFRCGPGKFTGFPGMVLEVVDFIGRQQWTVSSIIENKEAIRLPEYEILTRKEYAEKY